MTKGSHSVALAPEIAKVLPVLVRLLKATTLGLSEGGPSFSKGSQVKYGRPGVAQWPPRLVWSLFRLTPGSQPFPDTPERRNDRSCGCCLATIQMMAGSNDSNGCRILLKTGVRQSATFARFTNRGKAPVPLLHGALGECCQGHTATIKPRLVSLNRLDSNLRERIRLIDKHPWQRTSKSKSHTCTVLCQASAMHSLGEDAVCVCVLILLPRGTTEREAFLKAFHNIRQKKERSLLAIVKVNRTVDLLAEGQEYDQHLHVQLVTSVIHISFGRQAYVTKKVFFSDEHHFVNITSSPAICEDMQVLINIVLNTRWVAHV